MPNQLGNGQLALNYSRKRVWTPAAFRAHTWLRGDTRGVSPQGPDLIGQSLIGRRGLALTDGASIATFPSAVANIDTNPSCTITFACKITDVATDKFPYFEDLNPGGSFLAIRSAAPGFIRVTYRSTTTDAIDSTFAAFTDGEYAIFTLQLDDAATGWGFVVDGVEKTSLGTAYALPPAAYDYDRTDLGISLDGDDRFAFCIRHTSALTLTQIREVQQYVADQIADQIAITVTGGVTADSHTPQDEWKFDEDTGTSLANSGSAATAGTLTGAGISWVKETHVRGLDFNGVDNYVDAGSEILYENGGTKYQVTVLAYIDSDAQVDTIGTLYCDGRAIAGAYIQLAATQVAGELRVTLRDNGGATTPPIDDAVVAAAVTDKAWNVITMFFGNAGTWGLVVNGVDINLGTAYDDAPGSISLDGNRIGCKFSNINSDFFTGPIAHVMRHGDVTLTLTTMRQVQQYIADAVAADITLTIAGSEVANANSPNDNWVMDETTDGENLANSGSSSTIGLRVPGDRISQFTDKSGNGRHFTETTESKQPLLVLSELNGHDIVRGVPADSTNLDNQDFALDPSGGVTVLFVAKSPSLVGEKYLMETRPVSGTNLHHIRMRNSLFKTKVGDAEVFSAAHVTTWNRHRLEWDGVSANFEYFINDVSQGTAAAADDAQLTAYLFSSGDLGNFGDWDIAEALWLSYMITAAALAQWRAYTLDRYAV